MCIRDRIICIHELIHCKHKDILWKQLCGLVRVIHWWNPLVKQLDMDVDSWNETYCDLESTTIMKSKKRYFTTICEIGISPFAKGAYLCAALGEDKSQLKTRILRIKSDVYKRQHKSGVKYIAQQGGSVRDDDVIDCCNK